jgi:hypothetical protein
MPFNLSRRTWLIVTAVAVVAVLAGAAFAFSGGDEATTAAADTTNTTAAPSTTTLPPATYPLTGMPVPAKDAGYASRPALVVKIDNADGSYRGRPQQGINEADVVYEEMVEGSVTRFAAVFHSDHAKGRVIPVRSARSTDVGIFAPLNKPLFAWSGANNDFAALIRRSPMVDVGFDARPGIYRREDARRSPVNLWTTTQELWAQAPGGTGAPPPLFTFRAPDAPPVNGKAVNVAHVSYGGGPGNAPVEFRWDKGRQAWLRYQRGTPHVDETGAQVAAKNVIIQMTPYRDTGGNDVSGSNIYEAELAGTGDALVLTGGTVISGKWNKANAGAVTTYTGSGGQPIAMAPGQTWVLLPWAGHAQVSVQ